MLDIVNSTRHGVTILTKLVRLVRTSSSLRLVILRDIELGTSAWILQFDTLIGDMEDDVRNESLTTSGVVERERGRATGISLITRTVSRFDASIVDRYKSYY